MGTDLKRILNEYEEEFANNNLTNYELLNLAHQKRIIEMLEDISSTLSFIQSNTD